MNADRLISAEASLALVGVVGGDLVAQTDRTLPKPRRIMAVLGFYGLLSLIAGAGPGPARFAAAAGGLTALASLVLGATGRQLVDIITRATSLATTPGTGAAPASGSSSTGSAPPGYQQAPGGVLVPIDPNRGSVIPDAGRVRSPTTTGGFA